MQGLLDILLLTWAASEDYEIVVETLNPGILIELFFVLFRSDHFSQRFFDIYQRCKTRR